MPSKDKIELVADLARNLQEAKSLVVADYRGLTVAEVTGLRTQLREANVVFRVAKNRLMKIALKEAGLEAPEEMLTGPSAFAFSIEDPISGPKVLSKFAKDNEKLQIKFGLFEGRTLKPADVEALASMPSRDELLGRLLADLKSPTTKVAMGLKAAVSKIAYALKAVADQKAA